MNDSTALCTVHGKRNQGLPWTTKPPFLWIHTASILIQTADRESLVFICAALTNFEQVENCFLEVLNKIWTVHWNVDFCEAVVGSSVVLHCLSWLFTLDSAQCQAKGYLLELVLVSLRYYYRVFAGCNLFKDLWDWADNMKQLFAMTCSEVLYMLFKV